MGFHHRRDRDQCRHRILMEFQAERSMEALKLTTVPARVLRDGTLVQYLPRSWYRVIFYLWKADIRYSRCQADQFTSYNRMNPHLPASPCR